MKKVSGMLVLVAAVALSLALRTVNGQSINHSTAVAARDTSELPSINIDQAIREYILHHPEVIVESLQRYQDNLRAAQKERTKEALTSKLGDLRQDATSPVAGASNGVTVVEFFDYRCGFCKKAESTIVKLIADHPEVRFVFKEFPILGPESVMAAKASLAAHQQGGYFQFHQSLMTLPGPVTMDAIRQLAAKQGLDIERLKADMDSSAIQAILDRNQKLAREVGVTSTPTFVVDSELVPGAVETSVLETSITKAKLHSRQ